jgi:hypothetical protein
LLLLLLVKLDLEVHLAVLVCGHLGVLGDRRDVIEVREELVESLVLRSAERIASWFILGH